jgi:hypothetical protein
VGGENWRKNTREQREYNYESEATKRPFQFPSHRVITLSKFTLLIYTNSAAASYRGCREKAFDIDVTY